MSDADVAIRESRRGADVALLWYFGWVVKSELHQMIQLQNLQDNFAKEMNKGEIRLQEGDRMCVESLEAIKDNAVR